MSNKIQFIQLEDGLQQISGTGVLEFDAGSMLRVDTATISALLDVVNVEYLNNALASFRLTHTVSVDQTIMQNDMYNIWGDYTIEAGKTLNNNGRLVIVNGNFIDNGTYNQGVTGSLEIVNTNLDYILGRGNAVNGQDIIWTDNTGNWNTGESTAYLDTANDNVYVTKEWVNSKVSALTIAISLSDKYQSPLTTSGNEQNTNISITFTPVNDGFVDVQVNGLSVTLGDGIKTKDCYFSVDSGSTARLIQDITAGDTLYWNGIIAEYDLDAAKDLISLLYIS